MGSVRHGKKEFGVGSPLLMMGSTKGLVPDSYVEEESGVDSPPLSMTFSKDVVSSSTSGE